MDASTEQDRQIRDLTDQLAAVRDELRRAEEALDASRRFGAEQATKVTDLRDEIAAMRRTRTFRYTAGLRGRYGQVRKRLGR